jgi:WG containing repeat
MKKNFNNVPYFKFGYLLIALLSICNVLTAQNLSDSTLITFNKKSILCRKYGKYGIVSSLNDTVKSHFGWDYVQQHQAFPDMILIDSAGTRGILDKKTGKMIIAPHWNAIAPFEDGIAIFYKRITDVKTYQSFALKGLIHKSGKILLQPQYLLKRLSDKSLVGAQVGQKGIFLFDTKGILVKKIEGYTIYTSPRSPADERSRRYTIDSTIAAFDNHTILVFQDKDGELGLLHPNGTFQPLNYRQFSENHHWNDTFRYMFFQKVSNPHEPYRSNEPNRYLALHANSGKMYFLDNVGKITKDIGITKSNGKYGVLADTGVLLPNIYFDFTLLANKNSVAINQDTNLVFFSPDYKRLELPEIPKVIDFRPFSPGLNEFLTMTRRRGLVDDNGHILLPAQYIDLYPVGDSLFSVKDEQNNIGVLTTQNKAIIPLGKYAGITKFRVNISPEAYTVEGNWKTKSYFWIAGINKDYSTMIALFNDKGINLSGYVYAEVKPCWQRFFLFKKQKQGTLWGLATAENTILIPEKLEIVKQTQECTRGFFEIYQVRDTETQEVFYIDKDGKKSINNPCEYDQESIKTSPPPSVAPR